ncbi:PKD domain-containing protein [Polymorphospora rubra]|uniref:PKD domain-containing protein n=1 Tax=Polymorphospora rubra TaxID=338584 RepID=UPI00340C2D5D
MIAVRGATAVATAGSASSIDITVPGETQVGDLVVATVEITAGGAALSTPPAWPVIPELQAASSSSSSLRGASHRAGSGSAGASVTLGLGVSGRAAAVVVAYYDTEGQPVTIEQVVAHTSGSQTGLPPNPAADPTTMAGMAVAVVGGTLQQAGISPTLAAGTGYTLAGQAASGSLTLKNAVHAVAVRSLPDGDPIPLTGHPLSDGTVSPATATIILTSTNTAPVANAGPDQTVQPGALVELDGTASVDPDGTIVAYAWTQTSGPTTALSDPTSAQPTLTAPADIAGTVLVYGLVVTDDRGGASPQDTVRITVGATGSARARVGGEWVTVPILVRCDNAWQ